MPSIAHLLNRSVTIKRDQEVDNGQGGWTTVPTAVSGLSSVPTRRAPASGADRLVADREEGVVTHIWYFEGDPDIRSGDIIDDGGTEYEVLQVLPPSEPDHLKVKSREIQVGKGD